MVWVTKSPSTSIWLLQLLRFSLVSVMLFESPFLWKKKLFNQLIFLKGRHGWIWVFFLTGAHLVHPGKANSSRSFVPRDTFVSTTETHVVIIRVIHVTFNKKKNEERDLKQSSLVTSDKLTLITSDSWRHMKRKSYFWAMRWRLLAKLRAFFGGLFQFRGRYLNTLKNCSDFFKVVWTHQTPPPPPTSPGSATGIVFRPFLCNAFWN